MLPDVSLTSGYENKEKEKTESVFDFLAEKLQTLLGVSDEELEDFEDGANVPPVWPGATLEDPFCKQRLIATLIEVPVFQQVMYTALLFNRLAAFWGPSPALVVVPLMYAFSITGSDYDTTAMMLQLKPDDAFALNVITSR